MAAVFTADGEYSIIEMLGDELEVGDHVEWKGNCPLGSETIRNLTQQRNMEVFFQNHSVPKGQLRQQLLF